MSLGVILATASGESDDALAIALTAQLAQRHSALARIEMMLPDPIYNATSWGAGAAYLTPQVMDELKEVRDKQISDICAAAKAVAAAEGLAFGEGNATPRLVVDPVASAPWQSLSLALALVDLVVMAPKAARGVGVSDPLADTLMAARKPVLICHRGDLPAGSTIAIAWDGGLEAGRAVSAALPLLQEAARVVVLQDPKGLSDEVRDAAAPARLVEYLALHGVTRTETRPVEDGFKGWPLIAAAREEGAKLLVGGAYGHSRLREWMLGGVTRSFLETRGGPHLLLSH